MCPRTVIEFDEGRDGDEAVIGVGRGGGAACGGSLSLILVGCALELAYAGIVNGSGRSDINFLKYSYIMGQ